MKVDKKVAAAACGLVTLGLSACGGGSSSEQQPPPDPTAMALMAPGVRTVVVPKQGENLRVIIPPCSAAEIDQDTTDAPPGSNEVVVPKSALDQTVAVQPCIQGAKTAGRASTVLLSPGGTESPQGAAQQSGGQPQNQLLLPKGSNITRIIVPPCVVQTGSGGSSGTAATGGGTNTALPAERNKTSVVAPPCRVSASSSSSGG